MNCQTIQNRVIALPDPRQLPEALRGHVESCAACLAWWNQAVRIERLVAQLPAPPAPADKKSAMLDDLAAPGPVITSVPALDRRSAFDRLRSLPGLKSVAGLAAAVLIAVGGWMMMRPGPGPELRARESPRDPFLEKIVQRDLALAQAKSPDQRLEVLGGLADDLSAETRGLARVATQEDLRELSGLFNKVVDDGIVKQAEAVAQTHALTPSQKQALFERLAAKLGEAGRQAEDAARESPPHAQPVLKGISDKARDGQFKLKMMAGA